MITAWFTFKPCLESQGEVEATSILRNVVAVKRTVLGLAVLRTGDEDTEQRLRQCYNHNCGVFLSGAQRVVPTFALD